MFRNLFRKKLLRITALVALTVALLVVGVLWYHQVDNSLTSSDREYIPKFTQGFAAASPASSYDAQIEYIKRVQNSVLSIAPVNTGLPFGKEREPKDLFEAKMGLCFDRSRVIEKILRSAGFQTRHIFLLSAKGRSVIRAFATPGVASHAITEVLTERGWLVVDSNDRWISLDDTGNPRPIGDVQAESEHRMAIAWQAPPPPIYSDLAPIAYFYGLYSRHGEFYPPYDFIPDVNYRELLDNL